MGKVIYSLRVQSSLKYHSSKTIFVNAEILILYYKICIFAFMKIDLGQRYFFHTTTTSAYVQLIIL